jgi:T-complex protein 1 subunit gamma
VLALAEPFLQRNIHPTVIVSAYSKALQVAIKTAEKIAVPVDMQNKYVQ